MQKPIGVGNQQRVDQRSAAKSANAKMTFPTGDDAEKAYLTYRETDPFPDIPPALLNSAHIADYAAATGLMSPFDPNRLKSASYEVPLLGPYVYINKKGRRRDGVLKVGDEITIEKNSITFLTVEPMFRLPDYIALRHNLKIDHVYKGLLVGTGPLIDPGFVGRISLPLHNLTENDYTFTGGMGIIWVEFTKLSPIPDAPTLASAVPNQGTYVPFPQRRAESRIVTDYIREAVQYAPVPASSTAKTARTAKKAMKRVKKATTFGGLALLGVFITTFAYINNGLSSGRTETDRNDNQVRILQNEITDLKEKILELRQLIQTQRPPSSP